LQLNGSPGTDGQLNEPDSADFDGDGDVDGRDFLAWQRGFGTSDAGKQHGDADNDGIVDGADLGVWQDQYGSAPQIIAAIDAVEPDVISAFWLPSENQQAFEESIELISSEAIPYEAARDDAFSQYARVTGTYEFGDIAVSRSEDSEAEVFDGGLERSIEYYLSIM
jgi:hypothetical protein